MKNYIRIPKTQKSFDKLVKLANRAGFVRERYLRDRAISNIPSKFSLLGISHEFNNELSIAEPEDVNCFDPFIKGKLVSRKEYEKQLRKLIKKRK